MAVGVSSEGAPKITRDITGLKHGETLQIDVGKKGHHVVMRAFDMEHSIPCQSYGFYEPRSRLKPEYKNLGRQELVALRKQKVEVEVLMVRTPVPLTVLLLRISWLSAGGPHVPVRWRKHSWQPKADAEQLEGVSCRHRAVHLSRRLASAPSRAPQLLGRDGASH